MIKKRPWIWWLTILLPTLINQTIICKKNKSAAPTLGYYSFFPNFFPQATQIQDRFPDFSKEMVHQYCYKEFKTLASFEALRCSDRLVAAQAFWKSVNAGLSRKDVQQEILSAVENNQEQFFIYLQADIRGKEHCRLDQPDSSWNCWLEINGNRWYPSNIIEHRPDASLKHILGKNLNPKKRFYRIAFDLVGTDLHQAKLRLKAMNLILRGNNIEAVLKWPDETDNYKMLNYK